MVAFAVTAVVLVLLLFAAAFGVAISQDRLVEQLQSSTPTIKHWGGYVLMLVGAWFVALGVSADRFARVFPV